MPGVFILCPEHGLVQGGNSIHLGNGTTGISIRGGATQCPVCGRQAQFVTGDYNVSMAGDVQATLRLSVAQVQRLRAATRLAEEQIRKSPESEEHVASELRKTVQRESPALLRVMDAALTSQRSLGLAAWISAFLVVLQFFIGVNGHEVSEEDVVRIIQTYERENLHTELPPLPTPSPQSPPREGPTETHSP